ncbi:unnamed protein product [Chrysoparadoxa australica]
MDAQAVDAPLVQLLTGRLPLYIKHLARLRIKKASLSLHPAYDQPKQRLGWWDNATSPFLLLGACERAYCKMEFLGSNADGAKSMRLWRMYSQVAMDLNVLQELIGRAFWPEGAEEADESEEQRRRNKDREREVTNNKKKKARKKHQGSSSHALRRRSTSKEETIQTAAAAAWLCELLRQLVAFTQVRVCMIDFQNGLAQASPPLPYLAWVEHLNDLAGHARALLRSPILKPLVDVLSLEINALSSAFQTQHSLGELNLYSTVVSLMRFKCQLHSWEAHVSHDEQPFMSMWLHSFLHATLAKVRIFGLAASPNAEPQQPQPPQHVFDYVASVDDFLESHGAATALAVLLLPTPGVSASTVENGRGYCCPEPKGQPEAGSLDGLDESADLRGAAKRKQSTDSGMWQADTGTSYTWKIGSVGNRGEGAAQGSRGVLGVRGRARNISWQPGSAGGTPGGGSTKQQLLVSPDHSHREGIDTVADSREPSVEIADSWDEDLPPSGPLFMRYTLPVRQLGLTGSSLNLSALISEESPRGPIVKVVDGYDSQAASSWVWHHWGAIQRHLSAMTDDLHSYGTRPLVRTDTRRGQHGETAYYFMKASRSVVFVVVLAERKRQLDKAVQEFCRATCGRLRDSQLFDALRDVLIDRTQQM